MSTLSVPLSAQLEHFVDQMVKTGRASNKAAVVREALQKMAEDEAVENVLRAAREVKAGKKLSGDLDKLAQLLS